MDLLRLAKYFVVVAEERHFGHAARRLEMTQPPLSQGVARLESSLGVRLFDRGPSGVSLTRAGLELLPHAEGLLRGERDLIDAARTHHEMHAEFRVGVVTDLPASSMATVASTAASLSSSVVSMSTLTSIDIVDAVISGRLDAGVVAHPTVVGSLASGPVVRIPCVLLVPDTDPPSDSGTARHLLRHPLVGRPRSFSPSVHDLVTDTLLRFGCGHGMLAAEDERSALSMVAVGQACMITADQNLRARGVRRVPLPDPSLALRVRVVARPSADSSRISALSAALGYGDDVRSS